MFSQKGTVGHGIYLKKFDKNGQKRGRFYIFYWPFRFFILKKIPSAKIMPIAYVYQPIFANVPYHKRGVGFAFTARKIENKEEDQLKYLPRHIFRPRSNYVCQQKSNPCIPLSNRNTYRKKEMFKKTENFLQVELYPKCMIPPPPPHIHVCT